MDSLARVIALTDHFRFPPSARDRRNGYKEWHHFCIIAPDVQAILNLNLGYDAQSPAGQEVARVVLLVHDHAWDGDVETIPARDVQVHRGLIDARLGHNSIRFQDGVFDLSVALSDRPITLALRLTPVSFPLLRSSTPIDEGTISWLVVPRLLASGHITVGRRVYALDQAPAYHDHNWGHWLWGQDFAWQWGFALPESADVPWSMVFDRVTDRARNRALELRLAFWKGAQIQRLFMHDEIQTWPQGHFDAPGRVPKFPRVMALVAPEVTTDVPACLEVIARRGDDHLHCHFQAEDIVQVVVPNESDLGTTVINEVSGSLEASGRVKGEPVAMRGRGFFEFLT